MNASSKRRTSDAKGLTMVELLITMAAGAIVILGVYRLLTSSMWSYKLQSQMTDMYQNATYTIKELSEALEQAGANLPEKYYPVVITANATSNDISVRINKNSAKFTIVSACTTSKIKVTPDSVGKMFVGADSVVADTGGWAASIKIDTVQTGLNPDTIKIHSNTIFKSGEVIYSASTRRYFVSGTNYCIDSASNIQAENIDALSMTFFDSTHATTNNWATMHSCSLYVRARTLSQDPKYKCPGFGDGYHRLALIMNLRFRNRF